MATKKPAITVTIAKQLKLTSGEIATLKRAFKTDVTRVLKAARSGDPAPLPDVNVGGAGGGSSKKRGAKKSTKSASSKKK